MLIQDADVRFIHMLYKYIQAHTYTTHFSINIVERDEYFVINFCSDKCLNKAIQFSPSASAYLYFLDSIRQFNTHNEGIAPIILLKEVIPSARYLQITEILADLEA